MAGEVENISISAFNYVVVEVEAELGKKIYEDMCTHTQARGTKSTHARVFVHISSQTF